MGHAGDWDVVIGFFQLLDYLPTVEFDERFLLLKFLFDIGNNLVDASFLLQALEVIVVRISVVIVIVIDIVFRRASVLEGGSFAFDGGEARKSGGESRKGREGREAGGRIGGVLAAILKMMLSY